jgi:predicted nuclease of predicted toxin-antitoxin system
MKILFDQGTPVPLRSHLAGHSIDTAYERGWSNLSNGDLLDAAERDGYQLLITTDQNLRYQLNFAGRGVAIIALLLTSRPHIRLRIGDIQAAVEAIALGEYMRLQFDDR